MAQKKELELRVILKAHDRMSAVVRDSVSKSQAALQQLQRSSGNFGRAIQGAGLSATATGTALAYSMQKPVAAFMEAESASTRLATTMMQDGNRMSAHFEKVNALAVQLGNQMPGTSADLQNMMTSLLRNGATAEEILGGMGEATANLAVVLGKGYDETAIFSSKLGKAAGVASKDMMGFLDIIARTRNLGVQTEEMQYAFSKSSSALQRMGLTGLEASKGVSALYASLIQAGASGETVGTGMTSMFSAMVDPAKMKKFNETVAQMGLGQMKFTDSKGNFAGIENMIAQLDRLKTAGLSSEQLTQVQNALLGPGQDANFFGQLIQNGVAGYNGVVKQMAGQATMQDKVNKELGTLANKWDAATGTFTNAMASFAEKNADTIKAVVDAIANVSEAVIGWMNTYPGLTKWIGISIAAISALMIVGGGLALAIGGFASAISVYSGAWLVLSTKVFPMVTGAFAKMTAVMLTNPWMLAIAGIIAVGALIYAYWDEIVAFFKAVWAPIAPYFDRIWYVVKTIFLAAFNLLKIMFLNFTPIGLVIKYWDKLVPYFSMMWSAVKAVFNTAFAALKFYFLNFTPVGLVFKYWDVLVSYFSKLWDKVIAIFDRVVTHIKNIGSVFYEAGKNIVSSIFKGIEEMAYKPVEAIEKMTKKMREYLPFSPAKVGPFKDIHRVKIVETIADAIKPNPAVRAMQRLTVGMAAVAAPMVSPVSTAAGVSVPTAQRVMPASGGSTVLNYNPTITINGGTTTAKEEFAKLLKEHSREIEEMMRKHAERNKVKSF